MFLFTGLNALAVALEVEFPDPTNPGLDSQFGDLPVDPLGVTAAMSGMSVLMTLLVIASIGIGIRRFSITQRHLKNLAWAAPAHFSP